MSQTIRVVIADDQAISRNGMVRILKEDESIQIVGEASTLRDVRHEVMGKKPAILLLDMKWYGNEQAGIDLIKDLCTDAPETRIIAISVYEHLAPAAMAAGAAQVLNKEIAGDLLRKEIHAIYERACPREIMPSELVGRLSQRECQVLTLIVHGREYKEIAEELSIAQSIINNDIINIFAKLNVKTRSEAVTLGLRAGIIS